MNLIVFVILKTILNRLRCDTCYRQILECIFWDTVYTDSRNIIIYIIGQAQKCGGCRRSMHPRRISSPRIKLFSLFIRCGRGWRHAARPLPCRLHRWHCIAVGEHSQHHHQHHHHHHLTLKLADGRGATHSIRTAAKSHNPILRKVPISSFCLTHVVKRSTRWSHLELNMDWIHPWIGLDWLGQRKWTHAQLWSHPPVVRRFTMLAQRDCNAKIFVNCMDTWR